MANFFTSAFKGLLNPSTYRGEERLNGSVFHAIGAFFGYDLGGRSLTRYIKAFGSNILVYMIIHRISVSSSGMDKVYFDSSGEESESTAIQVVLENPNPQQGIVELYEEASEYLLATGNLFFRHIQGEGGFGDELTILNSSRMRLKLNSIGLPFMWVWTDNLNKDHDIPLEEILHIKTSNIVHVTNSEVYFGLSPLEAAFQVVKSSDEIFSAEASIFKNRGIIGILTNKSDTPMLKPERERLQKEFDEEAGGSDKYNKIKISQTELNYIQTGMSPTDLKLLEGIVSKLRLLCSVYGMNSVLFNDPEGSTFANVESAERSAINNVYLPLMAKIDRELSKFLSTRLKVDESVAVNKESIQAIKGSTDPVVQTINNLESSVATMFVGSMTRNQALDILGLPLLTGPEGEERIGEPKVAPTTAVQNTP